MDIVSKRMFFVVVLLLLVLVVVVTCLKIESHINLTLISREEEHLRHLLQCLCEIKTLDTEEQSTLRTN